MQAQKQATTEDSYEKVIEPIHATPQENKADKMDMVQELEFDSNLS